MGASPRKDRPNILWILSDQHNPHVAGFEGCDRCVTPHLDRLAASGTTFRAAYCQAPVCVPSRVSMLTGKHAPNCSAWDNGSWLAPEHLSMAEYLSSNGYTTALVGKAHLHQPNWTGGGDCRPYGDMSLGPFCFHQPEGITGLSRLRRSTSAACGAGSPSTRAVPASRSSRLRWIPSCRIRRL